MSSQQGASRLLGDLRRSPQVLLPYQADAVRELVQEIITLHESKTQLSAVSSANDPNINVQDCFLRRHKRCLVVYHSVRCNRVEALRWTTGAVLLPGAKENLASSEVDYFKAYSKAVSEYLDNCGLDLTTSQKPPKLDRIAVLAIKDCGVVQTASGSRNVNKGETHFMSRSDCEPLIQKGYLYQVHR